MAICKYAWDSEGRHCDNCGVSLVDDAAGRECPLAGKHEVEFGKHEMKFGKLKPPDLSDPETDPDYQSLRDVLRAAYDQAATGKGKERHARGNPFEKQHMQTISQLLNTDRGMAFQAIKKLTEGLDMKDPAAKERELLGAINYIAGIVVYLRQEGRDGP